MTKRRKATTRKRAVTGWRKNLPQIRFGILVLAIAILTTSSLTAQVWAYHNTQLPQVLRDAVMAIVAHQKAGDPVPVVADYNRSTIYDKETTWGIETNSRWLADYIVRIVPFFVRENVGEGYYPYYAFVRPWFGDESFNLGGRAECVSDYTGTQKCTVWLNERFFLDDGWMDSRDILSTLIHETIHIQGGNFYHPEDGETWAEKSAILESYTSAATIEVLAAMCNYGDQLACKTFWYEIEAMARQSLAYRLREDKWAYDLFANVFLRDGLGERRARKNDRYWAGHEDERYELIEKYGRNPYEFHILNGLKYQTRLDTGTRATIAPGMYMLLTMPFDDTADLLGFWCIWLILLTP